MRSSYSAGDFWQAWWSMLASDATSLMELFNIVEPPEQLWEDAIFLAFWFGAHWGPPIPCHGVGYNNLETRNIRDIAIWEWMGQSTTHEQFQAYECWPRKLPFMAGDRQIQTDTEQLLSPQRWVATPTALLHLILCFRLASLLIASHSVIPSTMGTKRAATRALSRDNSGSIYNPSESSECETDNLSAERNSVRGVKDSATARLPLPRSPPLRLSLSQNSTPGTNFVRLISYNQLRHLTTNSPRFNSAS